MAIRHVFLHPGDVFGRWTLLRELPPEKGTYRRQWRCQCTCGTTRNVDEMNLRKSLSRSCGCLIPDVPRKGYDGRSLTPEYKIWRDMKRRCYTPTTRGYANYGGRGITICEEWRTSFHVFLRDMGPRPSAKHSIERTDNDGPYSPDNCRWATKQEQSRNTRRNIPLTLNGRTLLLCEWADELGLTSQTLTKRLSRGWPVHEVLNPTPKTNTTRLTNRYIDFMGERRCLNEWARLMGISDAVIRSRLKYGWTVEKALTTPIR